MQSSAAMQWSCTGGQGNCFFLVNEEKQEENEEKMEEEENEQEEENKQEEDKIRTTMQSSIAMYS